MSATILMKFVNLMLLNKILLTRFLYLFLTGAVEHPYS